jgi:hypothetical protein
MSGVNKRKLSQLDIENEEVTYGFPQVQLKDFAAATGMRGAKGLKRKKPRTNDDIKKLLQEYKAESKLAEGLQDLPPVPRVSGRSSIVGIGWEKKMQAYEQIKVLGRKFNSLKRQEEKIEEKLGELVSAIDKCNYKSSDLVFIQFLHSKPKAGFSKKDKYGNQWADKNAIACVENMHKLVDAYIKRDELSEEGQEVYRTIIDIAKTIPRNIKMMSK